MIEGGLDIALLVILGYFVLRGLFRGVVKEVVAVLGLFVSFWVASVYWPLGEMHLRPIFDMPGQRGISSFIIIFSVVYFLTSIISIFVDKIVRLTISPAASALLGSVAGVIKGVLVCGILMSGAEVFLKPTAPFFTTSRLWTYLKPVTEQAKIWMPEGLKRALTAKMAHPGVRPTSAAGGQTPAMPAVSLDADWKTIQEILKNSPEAITQGWRDKLSHLSGGEALSQEELKRFKTDHPALFRSPQPPPPQAPALAPPGGSAAPTWPQPATE